MANIIELLLLGVVACEIILMAYDIGLFTDIWYKGFPCFYLCRLAVNGARSAMTRGWLLSVC